jgi:hypothetical protein
MTLGNSQFLRPRGFKPSDWAGDWQQYEVRNEACRRENERPLGARALNIPRRYSVEQVRIIYRDAIWRGVAHRQAS